MTTRRTKVSHIEYDIAVYPDNGCELQSSCLRCELPVCKEDDASTGRRLRDAQIVRLRSEGNTIEWLARRFDLSNRGIRRILAYHLREGLN